jgi:hypothetical protein
VSTIGHWNSAVALLFGSRDAKQLGHKAPNTSPAGQRAFHCESEVEAEGASTFCNTETAPIGPRDMCTELSTIK